eukprot:TRINITY_DN2872_c0_g1_i1.p1 TRINITY_DN2872_c0_g1~~TRINITY_DN2872_c0_g1_i1.p1  ORF type:complete len:156 (-),score=40.08 TRINITY_DN2872_c0_g1_i1:92-559(-)
MAWMQHFTVDESDEEFYNDLKASEEKFLAESKTGLPTMQTKFNCAVYLVRSAKTAHNSLGKMFFQQLLEKDSNNREYLYYLSIVCFKLEDYRSAREYVQALLQQEPNNRQALELQKMIQDRVKEEGVTGMLIAGGVGAAVVGLVGVLAFALKKNR